MHPQERKRDTVALTITVGAKASKEDRQLAENLLALMEADAGRYPVRFKLLNANSSTWCYMNWCWAESSAPTLGRS